MRYDKAVEIQNLKENTQEVLRAVGGLSREDAMNALGAAVSHIVIKGWPQSVRASLLAAWYSMVNGSLMVGE